MLMNRFELAGTGIQVKKDSMVRLNRASLNKGYVLYHVYMTESCFLLQIKYTLT